MSLSEICIRRPVFSTMLVMVLVVLGTFSYSKLGMDLFPKVDLPTVTVSTTWRGAGPEEIETQVTKPLEEAINTVSGIDELRSTSLEGVSQIVVAFDLEKDGNVGAQEVRDRVSRVLSQLPTDAESPVVEKFDVDAAAVMSVVVSSEHRSLRDLTEFTRKRIKEPVETVQDVGAVTIVGGREREIHVVVNADSLAGYKLGIADVKRALTSQNIEVPGGRVDQGNVELTLRTLGRVESPQDFENLVIKTLDGTAIRIGDVARVEDTSEEARDLSRLDGRPSLTLNIQKQSGTNTVAVIRNVKKFLNELETSLPDDVRVRVLRDQSQFITGSVNAVLEHLILGALLASMVVFAFMRDWRSTLITATAIPTSIIATFLAMWLFGFTLNNITLLGLVVAVGIVIDDAIVVLENIFRHMEEHGEEPMIAAQKGVKEITLAVVATTLSLVVIFVPLAFMGGLIGRFFNSYGITVAAAILVSMFVSFTLTPMLSSRFLKKPKPKKHGENSKDTRFYGTIDRSYTAMLRFSMAHRWLIVAAAAAITLSTVPLMKFVGQDFLPKDDQSEFVITLRAPEGTSLEAMDTLVSSLEADALKLPHVIHLLSTVGSGSTGAVNEAQVVVQLTPIDTRELTQAEIMASARELLARYPGVRGGVQDVQAIGGGGYRSQLVNFNIRGPDLDKLQEVSQAVAAKMKATPGFVDVDTTLNIGKPELRVRILRERAAELGVSIEDIASALRTMIGGEEDITKFKGEDDLYNVRVRVARPFRDRQEAVAALFVPSRSGELVRLDNVVELVAGNGPSQIDRQSRQRQVTVLANLEGQPLGWAIPQLDGWVAEMKLPATYTTDYTGAAKTQNEAYASFLIVLFLSVIFMYMVLAAQFESFIHPVTILLSLPVTVPFAVLSLVMLGMPFTIYSILGLFLLFGVVKKNAILQIDYTLTLRRQGMARDKAIMEANRARLRPILMTTLTIVFGMIPMALGTGPGSSSRAGMAVIIIGGQMLSLLITLLITPVAYSLFDDAGNRLRRRFSRNKAMEPPGQDNNPDSTISTPARTRPAPAAV